MSSHEPNAAAAGGGLRRCCAASCRTWRRGGPRATPSRADLRPGHQLRRLLHLRRGAAADHEAHQLAAGGRPGRDCCPDEGLRGDLAVPQRPHISDNCEFLSGEPSSIGTGSLTSLTLAVLCFFLCYLGDRVIRACVAAFELTSSTHSYWSSRPARLSKSRSPSPSMIGTITTCISSIRPARRNC